MITYAESGESIPAQTLFQSYLSTAFGYTITDVDDAELDNIRHNTDSIYLNNQARLAKFTAVKTANGEVFTMGDVIHPLAETILEKLRPYDEYNIFIEAAELCGYDQVVSRISDTTYNINGSNYFKLRDVAALLNGTGSQFALEYDAAAREIVLTTGEAYTPDGSELTAGEDQSATAVRSSQSLTIDGESASLTAFNIGGNNYFMLRDLGEALGFEVDYDAATRTMIINSK